MSYALGVDIGTTFSAAAVHRQGRAEMVALGYRSALVPSAVLINAEGGTLVGDAALRRGRSEPERLARFFKRRIGDSVPLIVGGSPFSAEQLTARLLRAVVDGVAEQQGGAPDAIALTRPANWGPFKQDRFDQAIRLADLRGVTVLTEPEAAALAYAAEERVEPGAVVAVYDLGGGTFDATLLRRAGDRFEVIGEPEGIERLGGIDFDAAVFEHVRRSLDGAIEALPEDDPNTLRAIARLRDDCIDAKEALSSDTQVSIPVVLPRLATEIRLTRSELEGMIRPVLDDSIASLRRAVASADVTAAEVDRVLLVGGSSRVPLVAQLVASAFGRPVALDAHPKHAVALGAALVAGGGGADARAIGATAAQPVIATPAGLATPSAGTPSTAGVPAGAGTPAGAGAPGSAGTPAGAGAPGGAGAGAIATGLAAGAAAGAAASGAPITAPPAPFTPEPTPDPRPAAAGQAGAPTSDPSEAPFAPVWLSGDPAEGGAGAGTAPAARTTADGSLPPRPATPPSGTGGPSGEWAPPNGRTGGPAGEPSGEWAPPTDRAGAAPSGDAIPAAGPVGPIGDEPTRVDTGDAWAAPTARHDQPSGDRWPANGGDEPTRVESDRTLVRPSAPGGPGDGPSGDRWAPPPAGRGDEPRDRGPSRPGVGAGAAAGMAAAGAAGVAAGGPSEMALASAGTDLGARPRYGREATPGGPGGPGSGEYVPGHASGYAGDDGPRKRRLVPLVGAIAAVGLIGAAAAVALSGGDDPEDTGSETTSDTSADTTAAPSPTTEPTAETLPTTLSIGAERRVFDGSSANVEGFTFDDEGNLWAAAQQGGFVSEVTAPSDEATYETISFTNDAGENAKPVTAVNSGGYIWAALRTDSAVARIDPTTHGTVSVPAPERPVFLYAAEDGYIYGISEGPQGDEDPTGTMFKLDPTGGDDGTGAVVAEVSLDSPHTLVVDGDNLWVTYGGSLVQNFDTNLSPAGVEITVGNGSESILSDAVTVDDEGYVWTANRNEATVSRIDPESEAVTGTFDVGGEPSDIEFDGARMWIVDTGDAEIPGHLKLFDASDAANGNVPLVTSIEVGLRPLDMYISDAVSDGVWVSVTQERDFSMVRVDATA